MSPGRLLPWRLLSPFAVLLWILAGVWFAGSAHADQPTDPGVPVAAGHQKQEAVVTPSPESSPQAASHRQDAAHNQDAAYQEAPSADLTSPQPISHADDNTGGANGQCPGGPYCSTRDGSPSHNGNEVGTATGEPCAGCVGKADNKNPHGQMPNASDANAGYECDTNHGIAKGNPAHTACVSGPQEGCVPTETVPCVPPPECVPTETVPCVSPPECVPTETVPCVSPPECVPTETAPCGPVTTVEAPLPPANQAVVAPPALVSAPAAALPDTGAPEDLAWLAGAALLSIAAGAALVTSRRRRVGS
jgi:LPXTG-motif cell wall-anchored protein